MKKKAHTIHRADLLKGGATAALTALLAAALEGRADACCSPIDLCYGDSATIGTLSPMAYRAPVRRPRLINMTGLSAVRIWAQGPPGHQIPPPDSTWKVLFSVPAGNAAVKGFDENGHGHGNPGGSGKKLAVQLFIYVK